MTIGTIVYKYLLKHRLTYKYMENLRNTEVNRPSSIHFNDIMKKGNKKELIEFLGKFRIEYAFAWSSSNEGYGFWYVHSLALKKEIEKIGDERFK